MPNKITESDRQFLSELVALLAFRDYYDVNHRVPIDKKTGIRKYIPYALSKQTLDAQEIYSMACKGVTTQHDTEAIKNYIARNQSLRDHLRVNCEGGIELVSEQIF